VKAQLDNSADRVRHARDGGLGRGWTRGPGSRCGGLSGFGRGQLRADLGGRASPPRCAL